MTINMRKRQLNFAGTEEERLLEILSAFEKGICEDSVDPLDIKIYSILSQGGEGFQVGILRPEYCLPEYFINDDKFYFRGKNNKGFLSRRILKQYGFTSEELEAIGNAGFFLQVNVKNKKKYLIPIGSFLNSFGRIAHLNKTKYGPDIFRDIMIAYHLGEKTRNLKIISRGDDKIGYGISVFSEKYQKTDPQIYKKIKSHINGSLLSYNITHYKTIIDFVEESCCYNDFPFEMGTRLTYSDVGDSSYKLETTMISDGAAIPLDGISHPHNAKFNLNDFLSEYDKKKEVVKNRLMHNFRIRHDRETSSDAIENLIDGFHCGQKKSHYLKDVYRLPPGTCTEGDVIRQVVKIAGECKYENESVRQKISSGIGNWLMKGA